MAKGGACAPTDVQLCYKTCGPEKAGVKSETCQTSGTYAEMSGCTFDCDRDLLLLQDPDGGEHDLPADARCRDGASRKARALTVATACLCNSMGGLVRRQLPRLDRRREDRLLRLPGGERVGQSGLELRERHGLAVPGRLGLLTERRA